MVKMVKTGSDGINGVDGFSPIANIEQTTGGAVITITDKNGTTTANINNGQDGRDGIDGQDGYTPVRGTDYWTAQDIATIEAYCSNYIDTHITQAIGGAY